MLSSNIREYSFLLSYSSSAGAVPFLNEWRSICSTYLQSLIRRVDARSLFTYLYAFSSTFYVSPLNHTGRDSDTMLPLYMQDEMYRKSLLLVTEANMRREILEFRLQDGDR